MHLYHQCPLSNEESSLKLRALRVTVEEENWVFPLLETHTERFCARMYAEFSPTLGTPLSVTLSPWR